MHLLYAEDDASDANDLAVFQVMAAPSTLTSYPVVHTLLFDRSATKPTGSKILSSFTIDSDKYETNSDQTIVALIGNDPADSSTVLKLSALPSGELVVTGNYLGTPNDPLFIASKYFILDLEWNNFATYGGRTELMTYELDAVTKKVVDNWHTEGKLTAPVSSFKPTGVTKTVLYSENIDKFSRNTLVVLRLSPT